MPHYYSDDPVWDAERWLAEQDKALEGLPACCECGDVIQQEKAVCVDGKWYCPDCELDAWAVVRKHYLEEVYQ